MKKIKIARCLSCPHYLTLSRNSCHRPITDVNAKLPFDCPLEEDTDQVSLFDEFVDRHYSHASEKYREELKQAFKEFLFWRIK